ncbi:MAG: HAMP domain-containing protein [Candidatus Schekmanbacteria bacterium]|nr:MAG: HAMP domain-containing protein [Candidatus Schekmanbacteria bacterium]
MIINNTRHDMLKNDRDGINYFFKDISKLEDLVNASIMDDEGVIKFSTKEKAIGMKINIKMLKDYIKAGKNLEFKHTGGDNILSSITEIKALDECYRCHNKSKKVLGYLSVDFSAKKIDEILKYDRIVMIITAIISMFFIAAALFLFNHYFIYKRVGKIQKLIEAVKKGELDAEEKFTGHDEISELGKSFNKMMKDLKEAKENLEEKQKEILAQSEKLASLGQLASGIAHEIQNPLAGISGALRVIQSEIKAITKDSEVEGILDKILSQIERLSRTTKDILSFARPSKPMFVPLNINKVIEKSLFFAREAAKQKGVEIVENLSEKLPEISADPELLRQVFLNIMLNGIQAMDRGGVLTISSNLNSSPSGIIVEIADTGCGIPEDVRKNIFNPFFTTKHQGTGLGLYIVKGIIENHNGEISVESTVGKGTTFKIVLPQNLNESRDKNKEEINS